MSNLFFLSGVSKSLYSRPIVNASILNHPFRLISLVIFGLSLQGCIDDSEPELLLTTNQFVGYNCTNCYAFVSDEKGRILDVKKIEPGATVMEFYGKTSSSTIMLTSATFGSFGTEAQPYDQYSFGTYQGIPKGTALIREVLQTQETNPVVAGNATFKLTGYTDYDASASFWPEFSVAFEDGTGIYNLIDYNSTAYDGTTYSGNFKIKDGGSDVLGIAYHNGKPVHKWTKGVQVGDMLEIDFASLIPSKTIPINKKVADGEVRSFGNGQSRFPQYPLSRLSHWNRSKSSNKNEIPSLGYIDGFEKYFVSINEKPISCCDLGTNLFYYKLGNIPSVITLPDYQLSITKPSITDFSFKFSNRYSYKDVFFSVKKEGLNLTWIFTSTEGTAVILPRIPKEVLEEYITLEVEKIDVSGINIYHNLDNYTYLDYINRVRPFNFNKTYEQYVYSLKY